MFQRHRRRSSSLPPSVVKALAAILILLTSNTPLASAASATTIGFDTFDADHNGQISRDEYTNAYNLISEALQSGRVPPRVNNGGKDTTESIIGGWTKQEIEDELNLKFIPAFINSVMMIFATEIGDKTFFIAAVLSMRNDRRAVFAGAVLALYIMTILSSMMGLVLPSLIPRQYTHIIGGILFLYFGIRLIVDSRSMSEGKCSDELEEVEEELLLKNKGQNKKKEETSPDDDLDVESNTNTSTTTDDNGKSPWERIFIQSLTLTFLAEWGDRSQIATIALAAAKDPYGVNAGAMVGHTICTGMAVIGGRMLAARISEKTVSLWGGVIFLIFGGHSLFFEEV